MRDGWEDDTARITDIGYDDAVADPIGQVARVYAALGLPLTAGPKRRGGAGWTSAPGETARPSYGPATHGLRPKQVDERFTLYNKRFRDQ